MQKILILGNGKLATALMLAYAGMKNIILCSRADFDALLPHSVETLIEMHMPSIVYNTVVFGGIEQCYTDSAEAFSVNTLFPRHLAMLSKRYCFKLVHFGSDAIFPDTSSGAFSYEDSLPVPPNVYALTKYGADCFIPQFTGDYIIFRLPVVFGPSPNKNQFLEKYLEIGCLNGHVHIANDVFSRPVYSIDVANYIISEGIHLASGVYHVCGKSIASLYEIMLQAVQCLNVDISVNPVAGNTFKTKDIKNMHVLLASHTLGPLRGYQEALRDYCIMHRHFLLNRK